RILVITILVTGDNSKFKGPNILFFTPNILFILLVNIGIKASLSNNKISKVVNIIIDNITQIFKLNNYYILYNKPLIYILVDFSEPYSL
ncbi:hypothetical protein N431DRAFT_342058, partial [Stipitochalara longipes BDJ]